ncbi:MAG: heparinase II/III family protein, partial [Planctomycetota bacterium]
MHKFVMALAVGSFIILFLTVQHGLADQNIDTVSRPDDVGRKAEYVRAVTRGAGFIPWQERGVSREERAFRQAIESRKDEILAARIEVKHPVLLTEQDIERARRNIQIADWAGNWYESQKKLADYLIVQSDDYIEKMVPVLTPTNPYGFTCPNCVGDKSQEAVGTSLMKWDYRNPDIFSCRDCDQVYPSEKYPETARLVCPRSQQVFTYYLNKQERKHPEDRTGEYAWHWVGRPVHVSFTGVIRQRKVSFMIGATKSLALAYRFTGDPRYAETARKILLRLAACYRNWLYHDYWDTIADCDPMYAAWHDRDLKLEWKRHLCSIAFKKDEPDRAAMLRNYWGAGRIHPSTDSINNAAILALAYDLVFDARDKGDRQIWNPTDRAKVERDLILEYTMGAEPFVGGANKATCVNNKSPAVYHTFAAVAKCLGLPTMADTALRGYENVRDKSFLYDGFSGESPSYTNMYLYGLVRIPEELHGFCWPAEFGPRKGTVNVYESDKRLRLMFRALIDHLRPDGRYPPLSDSITTQSIAGHLIEIGLKRYPEYYEGKLPSLYRGGRPTEYALFNLSSESLLKDQGLPLPEIYFPAWMTAMVRHGQGPKASMLTMSLSPSGSHRHYDNLSLFYTDGGHIMLGDHGYVGDMPVNKWIKSTQSHNLVVVDGTDQPFRGRHPRLHRMITSPKVSIVEASSEVYDQCEEYRRLVVLIKGPGTQTFAVNIFRVKGGNNRHDYRLFSELASSDVNDGRLEFVGLNMPEEKPLPQIGGSLAHEDIFGLRDVRGVDNPPAAWQALWKQSDRQFRVWMLAQADRVEASNGPGQETRNQLGRRVRYLDVIRQGQGLNSTFVAVHEPSGPQGTIPIHRAERLTVPEIAGSDAVALRIESDWGTYLMFSEFSNPAQIAGVRFEGSFGIVNRTPVGKRWMLTSGANTLVMDDFGFEKAAPEWAGKISSHTDTKFITDSPRPAAWLSLSPDITTYVLVCTDKYWTGFPVRRVNEKSIEIERFPLPDSSEFVLEQVRFLSQ